VLADPQRTTAQAQLDELTATATPDNDPSLLDELPYLTAQLDDAPAHLVAALLDALDIQVLYRPEQQQATIWATLTDTTPRTITVLLSDPRVAASIPAPRRPAETSTEAIISDSAQSPISTGTGHDHDLRPECFNLELRREGM
jgi:hypothetical protein